MAHLLTHTAGFEDLGTGYSARTPSELEPLGLWLAQHIRASVRPPGQLTAYFNYGTALAGYIVEQVSGMPYVQYVEQHIFQPLSMRSSTFRQPVPASLAAALSQGYTYSNGVFSSQPFEPVQPFPAGAMSTTATDMANFMIAQLQNGSFGTQRILQEATAKEMHTQQFTNDPRVPGFAYGFEEQNLNNQCLLAHSNHTNLFHALLALLPEQHVGLFVAYNSVGGAASGDTFLQAFLDHYFPALKASLPPPPVGSAQRIRQLSGIYWWTKRSYTTYEKLAMLYSTTSVSDADNGRLLISLGGQPLWTFVEVAPGSFTKSMGRGRSSSAPSPPG